MPNRFTLRPYQRDALAAVIDARKRGVRRMVVALPTGAGKTVLFSELARLARRPVLVLAHRSELVRQAAAKVGRALGASHAVQVEMADEHARPGARVVAASIRTLHPERLEALLSWFSPGLVIYDECHHATAEGNRAVLERLGAFARDWTGTLLGLTATTRRGDGQGLDEVFEEIVYSRSISQLVEGGYLVPLRGFRIATAADLAGLGAGSDFVVDELAERVDIEQRNALVARTIQELCRDRRTLVFCVTVAHATHLARALNALGVPTGLIHGGLKGEDRAQVLRDFRAGRLRVVTNIGVLTVGFDDPGVSCVAIARPTRSETLYIQCVGRGTRLAPGKEDCLVLDFVDLGDLSLVTLPTLAGLPPTLDLKGASLDEAERRAGAVFSAYPGFEVPPGAITLDEIERRAAAFDPLSQDIDPEVHAVSANAWESLGSRGLALHFLRSPKDEARGRVTEVLILDGGGRGRRWLVRLGNREVARFSTVVEAVQAVDYEVDRMGRHATESSRPGAAWRGKPPPDGTGGTWAERVALRCFAQHGPRSRAWHR